MSENVNNTHPENQPENPETPETENQDTAPETAEETFTVTRDQMEKMEQLAKMVSDASDKYLRLAAEYDNFRKRTAKEKESLYGDAKADTVKPFLEVLDNLERGLAQFEEGDPHRQGMEMICKQFMTVLEKLGVQQIEALGQPFDPGGRVGRGEHRGGGIPAGIRPGRQDPAVRHGEGSQLKGACAMNGKKLYKSRDNRMISGVCAGIAEYFNMDPTIIRLAWVLFSLLGGSGVLGYIIAAIVIPEYPMD